MILARIPRFFLASSESARYTEGAREAMWSAWWNQAADKKAEFAAVDFSAAKAARLRVRRC
jgi:hypothetical protein